jgi:hypothetical protein
VGLIDDHQRRPPKIARQMVQRLEKHVYETPCAPRVSTHRINDGRDLVFKQAAREQRGVAPIREHVAARADWSLDARELRDEP